MTAKQRILVVDDNATNVLILVRSLQNAGYVTIQADNGFSAVDVAKTEQPDLILLDLMMPDRDGYEVCRILKSDEQTAAIPIIFVTARNEPEAVVRAFEVGGSDYVTKPFRMAEVLARISVHIRLRQTEVKLLQKHKESEVLASKLAETNVELAKMSRLDALTNLLNRGAWEESAMLEQERSQRNGATFGVLMIDVDHFKAFNDSLGHQAGDECLRRVAKSIQTTCRAIDLVGRFGGEEFVVLAPETELHAAARLGERIRKAIWDMGIPHQASRCAQRVTVSVGVADSTVGAWEESLKLADDALYAAKKGGRNRVVIYTETLPTSLVNQIVAQERQTCDALRPEVGMGHVLLATADDTQERMCAHHLQEAGYELKRVGKGEDAIALAQQGHPDVIVMDRSLPDMEGLDCIRKIKSDPIAMRIPLILISSRGEVNEVLHGFEAGAEEYLTKPIQAGDLVLRVRSMLRLHRERIELINSYENRGEQTRILTLLLDFCTALSTKTQLEEAVEQTVAVTAEVCGCRTVSILLPSGDYDVLKVAGSIGIDRAALEGWQAPAAEGLLGTVFQQCVRADFRTAEDAVAAGADLSAPVLPALPFICEPLSTSGRQVGVLVVSGRLENRPFSPLELEYVDIIASIAGSAIHSIQSLHARDKARDSIVVALANLAEHRDDDTGKHVDRVTRYSIILARELATRETYKQVIDEAFIHCLARAVPLHDIGKVAIPDSILLKRGKLANQEIAVMRSHAEIGADTIRSVIERTPGAAFLEMAEKIARSHHEWYDGGGYPAGLRANEIPLPARIVALADVYDALTTRRVYKEAYSHDKARAIILASSGKQFHPEIVDAFVRHDTDFRELAMRLRDEGSGGKRAAAQRHVEQAIFNAPVSITAQNPYASDQDFDRAPGNQLDASARTIARHFAQIEAAIREEDYRTIIELAGQVANNADGDGLAKIALGAKRLSDSAAANNDLLDLANQLEVLVGLLAESKTTT